MIEKIEDKEKRKIRKGKKIKKKFNEDFTKDRRKALEFLLIAALLIVFCWLFC